MIHSFESVHWIGNVYNDVHIDMNMVISNHGVMDRCATATALYYV